MDRTYSEFVYWCFTGETAKYYSDYRWKGWEEDVNKPSWGQSVHFLPLPVGLSGEPGKPLLKADFLLPNNTNYNSTSPSRWLARMDKIKFAKCSHDYKRILR